MSIHLQRRDVNFSNNGFIVIFLVIVGVGIFSIIQSRGRAFRVSQRNDMGEQQTEPMLWEPWVSPGGHTWQKIMPLSTSVLRQEPGPLDHPPSELPQETDTPRRQRWPLRIAQNAGAVDRPADSHKPHELQVAVVIVMPGCNQECEGPRRKSKFADYNIGVTVVPWDKEL